MKKHQDLFSWSKLNIDACKRIPEKGALRSQEIGNELSAKRFILTVVGVFRFLQVASGYDNMKALPQRFWYICLVLKEFLACEA